MASAELSKSARIRSRLNHPVIDSDGHTIEMREPLMDYLKAVAGPRVAARFKSDFLAYDNRTGNYTTDQRRDYRVTRFPWWAFPTRSTVDFATCVLPKLLNDRLGEMGIDFSVIYTTLGFGTIGIEDDELRRACARALNRLRADVFRDFSYRLTPAAVIPMHTPEEAIEELEYAVKELGMKVAMVASYVKRPITAARKFPEAARHAYWMDSFGVDSEYDYDPVWAKCAELRIAPTFHSLGYGWGTRVSISNYIYNHLGNFAASAEAVCRSLFMGGVPRRFPTLKFAFMEGGVAWARTLYCDLFAHWEKRNPEAVENYNPANVDHALFRELATRYGRDHLDGTPDQILESMATDRVTGIYPALLDEWEQSGVRSPEDIRELFAGRFYFGCEGDDPLNALAYNPLNMHFDARLHALYGSDVGHWDVPRHDECLEEVWELVEKGLISEGDMRDFIFADAVRFWASVNPDFFKGTAVEAQAAALLAAERH